MTDLSSLLPGIIRRLPLTDELTEQLVVSLWPTVVGSAVAQKTRPTRLHRTSLIVSVPDQTWKKELFALRFEILSKLERLLGRDRVTSLDFRIDSGMPSVKRRSDNVFEDVFQGSAQPGPTLSSDVELEQRFAAAAASYFKHSRS